MTREDISTNDIECKFQRGQRYYRWMERLPIVQLVRRPGIIDLGWGHPAPSLLPVERIRQATTLSLGKYGFEAVTYGADAGAGPLLEWLIAHIEQTEGRAPRPDEIMITGGASEALQFMCTMCARPGDVVLVESPTYHLAVKLLKDHPVELIPIAADESGLRIDVLTSTLDRLRAAGRPVAFLYIIPTFQNPTGVSLVQERRKALVELAAARGLLIVEDDVYRELAFDGAAPPSLWNMAAEGQVARIGSFAKSLAAGLRLGWITAAAALIQRLVQSGFRDSGGGVNHFAAMVAAEFCAQGYFDETIRELRNAYKLRRDTLLTGLAQYLPAKCQVHRPAGGFFIWVTLPKEMDASALLARAESHGVSFLPGVGFHLDGRGTNSMRLSFSLYDPDELTEGAKRLGQCIGAER